jgi:hypothetical protein
VTAISPNDNNDNKNPPNNSGSVAGQKH